MDATNSNMKIISYTIDVLSRKGNDKSYRHWIHSTQCIHASDQSRINELNDENIKINEHFFLIRVDGTQNETQNEHIKNEETRRVTFWMAHSMHVSYNTV